MGLFRDDFWDSLLSLYLLKGRIHGHIQRCKEVRARTCYENMETFKSVSNFGQILCMLENGECTSNQNNLSLNGFIGVLKNTLYSLLQ